MSRARKQIDPHCLISEKDWTKTVIDAAKLYGWRVAHFRPALTKKGWRTPVQADGAGFPDLVLVRQFGDQALLCIVELKTEKGKVSPEQRNWLDLLGLVPGICVDTWHPSDWDRIVSLLKGGPDIMSEWRNRV